MVPQRLSPSELAKLKDRFPEAVSSERWNRMFHYSMRGYGRRNHKKYHNRMARIMLESIEARQAQAETESGER